MCTLLTTQLKDEMEMRASGDTAMAADLTPPLPPIAFSLHSSFLSSRCSSCSLPLPQFPTSLSNSPLLYCSPICSSLDSSLHFSSGETHLPSLPDSYPLDSSFLRLSLRLLHLLLFPNKVPAFISKDRICGLITNYEKFMVPKEDEMGIDGEDSEVLRTIKEGAKILALARRIPDGSGLGFDSGLMEEAMMCLVMTNAVEVQEKSGGSIGIAVYDVGFSWINHSCSPNACYRFSTINSGECCALGFRISPADVDVGGKNGSVNDGGIAKHKSLQGNGPRIIVRSIKEIKKGEEVTIAYTDLLRPKPIRQAELWSKYRFTCCCKRCSATTPTYADFALQGFDVGNAGGPSSTSTHRFDNDERFKKLRNCFEDAIGEYLSSDNPVACCEKLEELLTHVYLDGQLDVTEQESERKSKLPLLNHLSLDAYTTLASAYKIRAYKLLSLDPMHVKHNVEAFKMSKRAAAYSLLLAGIMNHLCLHETSFIASAANFWSNAGDSLLSLARSSFWEACSELGSAGLDASCFQDHACFQTAQLRKLLSYTFCSEDRKVEFEEISAQFLSCAAEDITNCWSFLTCKGGFLEQIKDLDIKCFWTKESFSGFRSNCAFNSSSEELHGNQLRVLLYHLGVHCLLHAAFLSNICYGQNSEVVCNVINFLVCEGILASH